ncbi:DUF6449 domain-containing protein [Halobacillus sp. BBL2006]|uniref:DUF6449 domain-containing protein n=1 Tax=Halobacillus sp. BBL2006 TaxID=1543706 RepID=UPI0005427E1B|nr:DUF6449 domain-containing protein [Halobacillus sp. BBL2006]KHE72798.1 hypothetical protein LD39_02680 [Halobacillus sp. BBL2006]
MPLKTSSFKKELFKQDFRNVGWISIVYLVGIFFTVPLQLMMALNAEYGVEPSNAGLFSTTFSFEIQAFFLLIMPVLMAVFLYRYLHVKEASDFIHSLPVRREKLFNYHLISGLILLLIPIIVNSLILLLSHLFADVSEFYTYGDLAYWTLLMVIITILTFMSGVFIGTLTGLSAVQGIFTYILLLFPAGIVLLVSYHIHFYVNGFSGNLIMDSALERFSPIVNVLEYYPLGSQEEFLPVDYLDLGIYLFISIGFYFSARIIYKKRQLESASSAIALPSLKPVLKYGMTFCFALSGGLYFSELQNSYPWIMVGYVIGAVFGYLLAAMLIEKTWRVYSWSHVKDLVIYGITAGILMTLLPLLWQSYESYIPDESNVEYAFLGNGYHQYEDNLLQDDPSLIRSEKGIETVRHFHEELIEKDEPLNRGDRYYFIAYKLKSGEEVYRYYEIDESAFSDELAQISETEEYKEIHYPAVKISPEKVQKISLQPIGPDSSPISLLDPERIEAFLESYQQDIYKLSYEEMVSPQGLRTQADLVVEGEDSQFLSLYPSYKQTMQWLKEEELYDQVMIQADDINRVEILPWRESEGLPAPVAFDQRKARGEEAWTVKEEEKLSLAITGTQDQDEGEYLVAVYYDSNANYFDVLSFTKEEAPGFITDHFMGNQ